MPEPARPRERIARLLSYAKGWVPKRADFREEMRWHDEVDALLAAPAPDAATPCTGACARHCPTEGRDG